MTRRLAVGDIEIAFEDLGDPAARPLVLVHGFTGHRDDFVNVRDALATRRRVLVPDLRGHGDSGRSARPEDYTFEAAVGDLLGLLDALDVDRCDLLGHSMGGMVALRFALAHPERLASFVAMNTSPEPTAGMLSGGLEKAACIALEAGMAVLQEKAEQAARRTPDPVIERWSDRYWTHHRRRFLAMEPAAYAGFGVAMTSQSAVTSRLGEIHAPALVIVGDADADFLPGAALLESGLAAARRVTLSGAGHHPHEESREAWLAALEEHLAEHGA